MEHLYAYIRRELDALPRSARVFVKIAAGINNYSGMLRSSTFRCNWDTTDRKTIYTRHPGVVVSIVTIPPVIFEKHRKVQRHIFPGYMPGTSRRQLEVYREHHLRLVQFWDHQDKHHPSKNIYPQTASWHSKIYKVRDGRERILSHNLEDGIHGSPSTTQYWLKQLHKSFEWETAQLH